MQLAEAAEVIAYIAAARVTVRGMSGMVRDAAFAALNLAGYYFFFAHGHSPGYKITCLIYVPLVLLQYLAMRLFAERKGWLPWIAFFTPILALIALRYLPPAAFAVFSSSLREFLREPPRNFAIAPFFVGISYLAFRNSLLVLEVRNGIVKKPNVWQYLGYSFFVPTMPVGPINPYSNHLRGFEPQPPAIPPCRALLRMVVGLVKYKFLGGVLDQLTYSGLLRDDHMHHWIDLPVAVVFYYFFLYCNFSGFCDMAIGAAGLIGIPVKENFNDPFAARNVQEFWNRWHISLSHYMRDVVFTPLTKFLAGIMGPRNVNHAVAVSIAVVFLLVGIWHGVGWNYVAFGAAHSLALVVNHYYTVWLKKRLGREGFKAYIANPWIRAAAVGITFCYCAACLFFMANSFSQIRDIFNCLVK